MNVICIMTLIKGRTMNQNVITTVDVVLLTLAGKALNVVLMKRDREPFKNQYALPGGYIRPDEDVDVTAAAKRVLKQKTGIVSPYLEQLYTFSGGARDLRGWSISVAHYALVNESALRKGGNESFFLFPADNVPPLPFDHNKIIEFALERLRNKSSYSSLPSYLLPPQFTLTELQHTYELIMGTKLDKSVFRRKLSDLDFLEPVKNAIKMGKHRPAQLYKIKKDNRLVIFDRTV